MSFTFITVEEAKKMFGFLPDNLLPHMWLSEESGANAFPVEKEMLKQIREDWNAYYYNK